MTKRKENEPDNKAGERLKEFNRERQAIPGENIETNAAGKNETDCVPGADNPEAVNNKKNIKKSPKK